VSGGPVGLDGEQAIRDALAAGPTPGPWLQAHRRDHDGWFNTEVFDAFGEAIARLTWYPKQMGNGVTATYRETNARLIAACNPETMRALLAELDRLRSASRQEGWQLVPVEPTVAMAQAAYARRSGLFAKDVHTVNAPMAIYRDMLAAAPHQAQEAQGDRHGE
jgi:hypothetical protein